MSASAGPGADIVDGRRRRGQDNRERIVAALMALIRDGELSPSAEQVAARADVGLRTVFRHFQDMETLYREISKVIDAEVLAIAGRPFRATRGRELVMELISRRAEVFERIAPVKRASDVLRHRSPIISQDHDRLVFGLRVRLVDALPPDIAAQADTVEALDLLMSFEAWSRLRNEQGLDPARAQAVVEAAVGRLLG